jgi:uncharacterized membrane protein YjdF
MQRIRCIIMYNQIIVSVNYMHVYLEATIYIFCYFGLKHSMKHYNISPVAACMVIMVHVVKVVNIVYTFNAQIAEMESETNSRPRK